MAMEIDSTSRIKLPGFGLPVDTLPPWEWDSDEKQARFPHNIVDDFTTQGVTMREIRMLEYMDWITDIPSWNKGILDEDIVRGWKKKMVEWDGDFCEQGDWWLSEKMFEACILELKEKANKLEETGFVAVLDADALIVKSDSSVPRKLQEDLISAVRSLEVAPGRLQDWHPDNQVLNLLHPSLFPVVYGLSRALPTGSVSLEQCLGYICKGEAIPNFDGKPFRHSEYELDEAWSTYQWLPTNVMFTNQGTAKINNYINNLHPRRHMSLYDLLRQFVQHSIPLWNECLSYFHDRIRIQINSTDDNDYSFPAGVKFPRDMYRHQRRRDAPPDIDDIEDERVWARDHNCDDEYMDWSTENRVLRQYEPEFTPQEKQRRSGAHPVDLRKDFAERGIQVIFKLVNIHLTPDNPMYDGESWHVEGSLNEHICAVVLCCYDSENVTESRVGFRHCYDTEAIRDRAVGGQYDSCQSYYDLWNNEPANLRLGSVCLRRSRLVAFPNVFQHCIEAFSLVDLSKPRYQKVLAIFLVDPHIPILSTANVPPQQRDWWAEQVRCIGPFAELPVELFDMIIECVDGFPISFDAAVKEKEKVEGERARVVQQHCMIMENDTIWFAEA